MQWNHMEPYGSMAEVLLSCSGCPMTWGLAQKSCLDASHYTLETCRDDKPKNLSSTKPNEVLERVEAVINTEWTSSMSQMRQDQFSMLQVMDHGPETWSTMKHTRRREDQAGSSKLVPIQMTRCTEWRRIPMETSLRPEKLRLKLMFHEFVAKLSEAIPVMYF